MKRMENSNNYITILSHSLLPPATTTITITTTTTTTIRATPTIAPIAIPTIAPTLRPTELINSNYYNKGSISLPPSDSGTMVVGVVGRGATGIAIVEKYYTHSL